MLSSLPRRAPVRAPRRHAPTTSAAAIAAAWLDDFAAALAKGDTDAATALFLAEGWWRDLLAFTWDLRTFHGTGQIGAALADTVGRTAPTGFALESGKEPELDEDSQVVTAFFRFETGVAEARGLVRLVPADGGAWKVFAVLTAMEELKGHERKAGHDRPQGTPHGESRGRETGSTAAGRSTSSRPPTRRSWSSARGRAGSPCQPG